MRSQPVEVDRLTAERSRGPEWEELSRAVWGRASHLTYAVGDVHGCYDLLRRALDAIAKHARGGPHHVILLGDYIDRGRDARRTLEFLIAGDFASPVTCLKGNHEQMMVDIVNSPTPKRLDAWLRHGGQATLESYGLGLSSGTSLAGVPEHHVWWMRTRPSIVEYPHHIFVHAGISPDFSLIEQDEHEFLWIRDSFLRAHPSRFVDNRHIVHGHTQSWEGKPERAIPELLLHRTNLDSGAYATGVLSVGVFESDARGGVADLLSIV